MNKKGFTLTELLAVVVILGIISGLSIPLIRNLSSTFEKNKYKYYAESVLSSAKLYNNSYSEDIFGRKQYGCGYVTYEQLTDKKLLKDISDDKITCATNETFVKIFKRKDKYSYKVFLGCNKKNSTDTTLIRYPENALEVIDTESCTGSLPNNIKIEVDDTQMGEEVPVKKKKTTKLYLSSGTGIASNISISTAWSTVDKGWNNVDESAWTKQTISVPKHQESQIDQGETILAMSKTISTPANETGGVYLLVRVDELKDIYDSNWANKNQEDGKFLSFGPFIIDNLGPKVTAEVYNCEKYTVSETDENGQVTESTKYRPTGDLITSKTVRGITDVATVSTKDMTGSETRWLNGSTSPVGVCTSFKAEDESGLNYYIRESNEDELAANAPRYKTIATVSNERSLRTATKCKDEDGNDLENCVTKNLWITDNGHKYVVYNVYDMVGNYTSLIYDIKRDIEKPTCGDVDIDADDKTYSVECSDTGGSKCVKSPYTGNYTSTGTTISQTIKDNAGNKKTCSVKIPTVAPPKVTMKVYKCDSSHNTTGYVLKTKKGENEFKISLDEAWYAYKYGVCVDYSFKSSSKIKRAELSWNKSGIKGSDWNTICSGCTWDSNKGKNKSTTKNHDAIKNAHVGLKEGNYSTYIDGNGHRFMMYRLTNEEATTVALLDVWLDIVAPEASHSSKTVSSTSTYITIKCSDSMSGCDTKRGDIGSKLVNSSSKTFTVYDKAGNSATTTVKRNFSYCKVHSVTSEMCSRYAGSGYKVGDWKGPKVSSNNSTGTCTIRNYSNCKKAKNGGINKTTYYYKFS